MSRHAAIRVCALCLGVAAPGFAVTLTEVARLPPADLLMLTFGDTDHDGRNEVLSTWRDANFNFSYRIYELQGDNTYTEEYRGAESYLHVAGDLDLDGRTDLVGQWGSAIQIFESPSPTDYPTQLVWTLSSSNILGPVAIADTDRDGKPELIQFMSLGTFTSRLRIFESVGDNAYDLVHSFNTHAAERPVIGDWDGDGLVEIAYCGRTSKFFGTEMTVIESTADNTWTVTFTDSAGLVGNGVGTGGTDTDGNGRIELFFYGLLSKARAAVVYEPVADNVFEKVAFLSFDDGSTGASWCTFGNIDGQGSEELLLEGVQLRVYRSIAVGTWVLVGVIANPTGLQGNAKLFDANRNGIPELFWPSDASDTYSTLVFEYDPTSESTPEPGAPASPVNTLVVPSPSRSVVRLYAPGFADRIAAISVYDVAGRLIERAVPIRDSRDALIWTPRRLVAGVYLIRAETNQRQPLATRRVVLVH